MESARRGRRAAKVRGAGRARRTGRAAGARERRERLLARRTVRLSIVQGATWGEVVKRGGLAESLLLLLQLALDSSEVLLLAGKGPGQLSTI